ncbi:MAG TPA: hypothetical protein VEF33_13310 [Syntrophales bacterium]|nr:hypothetical protein [Syntrophales bacterium]
MENEALNTIYSRRSVRSFTGEAVSRETLTKILKSLLRLPRLVARYTVIMPYPTIPVTY